MYGTVIANIGFEALLNKIASEKVVPISYFIGVVYIRSILPLPLGMILSYAVVEFGPISSTILTVIRVLTPPSKPVLWYCRAVSRGRTG